MKKFIIALILTLVAVSANAQRYYSRYVRTYPYHYSSYYTPYVYFHTTSGAVGESEEQRNLKDMIYKTYSDSLSYGSYTAPYDKETINMVRAWHLEEQKKIARDYYEAIGEKSIIDPEEYVNRMYSSKSVKRSLKKNRYFIYKGLILQYDTSKAVYSTICSSDEEVDFLLEHKEEIIADCGIYIHVENPVGNLKNVYLVNIQSLINEYNEIYN